MTTIATSEPTDKNSRGWPVYEQFMGNDWTKGAAGTGEVDFAAGIRGLEDQMLPILAESWDMPDPSTWILNIRQGVHWQPLDSEAGRFMGGREMTADDVVNSWNWQIKESPNAWIQLAEPEVAKTSSIEKTGPWQVTITTPTSYLTAWGWVIQGAGFHRVYPYDLVKEFDHELIYRGEGWHYTEAVGTGPFMVEEVVPGVLRRFKRNPLYWDKDPVGPGEGNQLPYIDTRVELYIPDRSTQMAALRTGKISYMTGFIKEDWEREMQLSPELQWASYLNPTTQARMILMRTDKKDMPYSDVRVRQALMLATDFEALKNDYYGGQAEYDIFPLNSNYAGTGYLPLSEMPESVQDLYRYNPEKAKELLKEAGYPNGFKGKIIVSSAGTDVDDVSIFKDMWAKVGVELVIDVREVGVFNQIAGTRAHEEMIYRYQWTSWPWMFGMIGVRGSNTFNYSYINDPPGSDPILEEYYEKLNENMIKDMPEVYRLLEELRPYFMEQAYVIPRPTPYMYNLWQPWLKNFYGFTATGYKYHWIDQELKKEMGH